MLTLSTDPIQDQSWNMENLLNDTEATKQITSEHVQ